MNLESFKSQLSGDVKMSSTLDPELCAFHSSLVLLVISMVWSHHVCHEQDHTDTMSILTGGSIHISSATSLEIGALDVSGTSQAALRPDSASLVSQPQKTKERECPPLFCNPAPCKACI
jgi:hypothetical protein